MYFPQDGFSTSYRSLLSTRKTYTVGACFGQGNKVDKQAGKGQTKEL
jgi:hypothetical protein